MADYPPKIKQTDFTDVLPPNPNQVDPLKSPICGIITFGVVAANQVTQTLTPTSFDQNHDELATNAAGRYLIAPSVANDAAIYWTISGGQHIVSATFELFQRNNANPLWQSVIQNPAYPNGHLAFDGAVAGTPLTFPDGFLTAEHAPYKLRMTITPTTTAFAKPWVRWVYIDVVVADITISLGAEQILPQEPTQADAGYNRRNKALRTKMENALTVNNHSLLATDAPTIKVPLDGNIFGANSNEWNNNTAYQAWKALWRDGPYIPLVATVRVKNLVGQPVVAPSALGNARFLWDWEGGTGDLSSPHPLAQQSMTTTYNNYQPNDGLTGGKNAHVKVGGKRGNGSDPLFETTDGQGVFPFQVARCGNRHGAAFSYASRQPNYKAQTGVVFSPSLVAGDSYKLRVYFAYENQNVWDVNSTAIQLSNALPFAVPSATTGEFVVERVVKIAAHWKPRQDTGIGDFKWSTVAAYFRQANITLDTTAVDGPTGNATAIDQVQFQTGFTTGLDLLPHAAREAFAPANKQGANNYGLECRSYDQFKIALGQRYNTRLGTITNFGLAQLGNAAPNVIDRIQTRLEIYLELVRNKIQSQGQPLAMPPVNAVNFSNMIDHFNGPIRGVIAQTTNNLQDAARGVILGLLIGANVDANIAKNVSQQITQNATPIGDADYLTNILVLAGLDTAQKYEEKCKNWGNTVLTEACVYISKNNLPNTDGMQVFQFDFQDNFDNFSASGWAFDTPSNRTNCPECDAPLNDQDRQQRTCPTCLAVLRTNAAIMTLVPWKYMKPYSTPTMFSLHKNKDKYWLLSNMEGVKPEILVVHEVGHHLFLPHAPYGFEMPNPTPTSLTWGLLKLAFWKNPSLKQQIEELTKPAGDEPNYHATSNHACIMGYNFAQMQNLHFCAKCSLRLRGWSGAYVQGFNL